MKILIADDHTVVREGFRTLLERIESVEEVLEAPDGDVAVEIAERVRPEIVILDILMPKLSGVSAASRLAEAEQALAVIPFCHNRRPWIPSSFLASRLTWP